MSYVFRLEALLGALFDVNTERSESSNGEKEGEVRRWFTFIYRKDEYVMFLLYFTWLSIPSNHQIDL